ncbi:MAG: arginine--tRNA ligase, partial [Methylobacteriaceae bacterium]
MNIFATFEGRVRAAVQGLIRSGQLPEGLDLARVVVEPPRDASHGDLATNAALVLAKEAKTNPKALGETLAAALRADPDVVEAQVAGPGFINLRLAPGTFHAVVRAALA